jgi:sialate O-acetylesterase
MARLMESPAMQLAQLFSDGAVVQRDIPIPVWGWTQPLSTVRVRLGGNEAVGIAADDGKFLVRLPAMPAGGPHTLTATDTQTSQSATAQDVYVGEVWLASGQSNMEWTLASTGADGQATIAAANDPLLRMFRLPKVARLGAQRDTNAAWRSASPRHAPLFSAVAHHFAARLRRELNVAVGVVDNSWGGTMIEAWIGRAWLVRNPHTAAVIARTDADLHHPDYLERFRNADLQYTADPGNRGHGQGWADAEHDDSDWLLGPLPRPWQNLGHNHSGVFWFRKAVEIPAAWAGKPLLLRLGSVDKQDITYFNGRQVGAMGRGFETEHWNKNREYTVPGELVRAGRNVIAVRAYSFVFAGGMLGPADVMDLTPADGSGQTIPLAGEWRYRNEHNFGLVVPAAPPLGQDNPNTPCILHGSMVAPVQPYALRGAIWYQGESNAGRADEYHSLMLDLIRGWRHEWGQGDFPFLFVQLANYRGPASYDLASTWARVRDAQRLTLREPGTGMAVAIDIGEELDIHPINKRDVGERLARWALARTYQRNVVASGPLYRQITLEGPRVRVHFDFAQGLAAKDGELKTFVLAGSDRQFRPARARVEGCSVVVESDDVAAPIAVRYAWSDNPVGCNLVNGEGLPASPFRSDNWT